MKKRGHTYIPEGMNPVDFTLHYYHSTGEKLWVYDPPIPKIKRIVEEMPIQEVKGNPSYFDANCSKCGAVIQRKSHFQKFTCFDCKMKRTRSYHLNKHEQAIQV